jgi:peptide/nickel transport system substrate-binding protein
MRARGWRLFLLLGLLSTGPGGLAAVRARLGGTLTVGLVGLPPPSTDVSLEGPEADSLRTLLALPLCRLWPERVAVLASIGRAADGPPEEVLVTPLPAARFPDGSALGAGDVALSWKRLASAASPYMSLLAPVSHLEEVLDGATQHPEAPLRLRLQYPWPDLEASLCHPAFTPTRAPGASASSGVGLYGPLQAGRAGALRGAPGGPPFPLSLSLVGVPSRSAARLLQHGEVHALLGEATAVDTSPLLFATYLVYRPGSLSPGALSALSRVDVEALVRTFVPGPAVALHGLLPEALGAAGPLPKRAPPLVEAAGQGFTLGYELALPEQRAVAERLQVLLHDAGYALRLRGDSQANLARARARGELEASLVSVLLPPLPAPALAVVLGLPLDASLLARELPALGALADAEARSAKAAARARELLGEVPVFPLYARGLRVKLSDVLMDARRDAFGLLVLDEAWLVR